MHPTHEQITAALTEGPLADELVHRAKHPGKTYTAEQVAQRIVSRYGDQQTHDR